MKCTIQTQNKQATLTVKQLILFQQCQLIHAEGRSGQDYYLIFHDKRYVNTIKVKQLKQDTFIHQATEQGLIVTAPHHAIYTLINQQIFTCIPLKRMLANINGKQKSIESIIILSYFDQFIAKEKIITRFIKAYQEYRRNGQLKHAHHVLLMLQSYDPENQFAHDILTSLTFQGYQVDKHLTLAFNPLQLDLLEHIYLETESELELSILSTVQLLNHYSEHHFQLLQQTLNDYPIDIQRKTLRQLIKQKPSLIKQQSFANAFLNIASAKQYITIILQKDYPHPIKATTFTEQLERLDKSNLRDVFLKKQNSIIARTKNFSQLEKEKIARLLVEATLPFLSLDDILIWLEDFDQSFSFQPQLLSMKKLVQNPDQQEQLADLYLKFNYLDGAIECLKWEVELDPTNEAIYKKLIKLLKESNQHEEADAFQEQWIQQTKYSK